MQVGKGGVIFSCSPAQDVASVECGVEDRMEPVWGEGSSTLLKSPGNLTESPGDLPKSPKTCHYFLVLAIPSIEVSNEGIVFIVQVISQIRFLPPAQHQRSPKPPIFTMD
ncbi:hypothetical protein JTE90_000351 [Oedothorax gibbosus]|uniref:Uncharacterized protein n=1 Tax=Oedothorax gibbosus TaxID=931172 RepID=A0AAV6U401_9ARAC|nr:hypothetical protein JTE90_000351 [Oedothorax gibbosus]